MQAEQKRKELFETTLAYQKAQQNALASDQPVESKFRKQAATAKIELGYAEAKVARAEYELSQLNVSDSDCLLIKQQTSEEAIAAAQSNLDVMGSLRFHIFSYERLKKKAESPQASEKIKDAFRVVEANPTLREFAQLGDSLGKLWAPNTTPEMAQQSLDAIKEKLLQLMPDTALVKSFCSFLTRRQGQLIYAGMAQVSNSRVEGMNSQAKACQRVTRGVKSLLKYFLTLMRLFGDTREHWRSGSSCHSTWYECHLPSVLLVDTSLIIHS